MAHVPKKDTWEDFLDVQHLLLFYAFYFFLPDQPLYTVKNIVYIHTSDCAQTVYALLLLLNNTASETLLHQSGVVLCTE